MDAWSRTYTLTCLSSLSAASHPLPSTTSHACRPIDSGARAIVTGAGADVLSLAGGGIGNAARRVRRRRNFLSHVTTSRQRAITRSIIRRWQSEQSRDECEQASLERHDEQCAHVTAHASQREAKVHRRVEQRGQRRAVAHSPQLTLQRACVRNNENELVSLSHKTNALRYAATCRDNQLCSTPPTPSSRSPLTPDADDGVDSTLASLVLSSLNTARYCVAISSTC
jgi:hypothetical protein